MGNRIFKIQLADLDGRPLLTSGGKVYVATNGDAAKATLYNSAGASLTNPVTPTRGQIEFYVADSVTTVDLYGVSGDGYAFQTLNVAASGPNEIKLDTNRRHQTLVIPFAQGDFTANTETATGFVEPTSALMLPNPAVRVTTIDATETIDVGTLSTDTGDADGFIAGLALGTPGLVKATVTNGSNTMGALFEVQDSANAGDINSEGRVSGGKSITITTSAGSDTGEGFIYLPYLLAA
jgi:hypothetical protein